MVGRRRDGRAMIILPAIDLKGGRCVRLRQGRAEEATVYADDPVKVAVRWQAEGAGWLHVVDLDGAFQGRPVHTKLILRMAAAVRIPIEVGGGLRTDEDVEALLSEGIRRVILGTRAWQEPEALQRLVDRFGDRVAVGIDAREGRVQVRGWTETTGQTATDLARRLEQIGIACLVYTDTARDGMLSGVPTNAVDRLCGAVGCSVIASGGVASAADVRALRALNRKNLIGVIVGKALYEGRVTLNELKEAACT